MKRFALFFLIPFLLIGCQQDINDDSDSGLLPLTDRMDIQNISVKGDIPNFSLYGGTMMRVDNDTFEYSITLSAATVYSAYFTINYNNHNLLLWGGSEKSVEFYNPSSPLQTIPKQRPAKFHFSVPTGGTYKIILNTKTMQVTFDGPGQPNSQNNIIEAQFCSSRYTPTANMGWDPLSLDNQMTRVQNTLFVYSITNLIPGRQLKYKFVLNRNTNYELGKDPSNPFTQNNNFLDAVLYTQPPNAGAIEHQLIRKTVTSEIAIIYLNTLTRSYSMIMNPTPMHADGYFSQSFYGPATLSNTNSSGDFKTLHVKNNSSAWYFGINGTLTNGNGVPADSGAKFVIFIDAVSDTSGRLGNIQLYTNMPAVTIPAGRSVEYMLVIEAALPAPTRDSVYATRWYARLFGPINSSTSNITQFPVQRLPAYANNAGNGFFNYGDFYEILIPKLDNNGNPFFNTDNIRICAISWNVGTNWGNSSNSNLAVPIAESLPAALNASNLPASADWANVN